MTVAPPAPLRRLKLLSFNVQTGLRTESYPALLTGSVRQVFPSRKRLPNLRRIARFLGPFDIVGLQEVDGGSLRSHRLVQTQYLADQAGFPYWHNQVNRHLAPFALHSNGLISRLQPHAVTDYPLPGLPGRGAILAQFGARPETALHLIVTHLALSQRARMQQMAFLGSLLHDVPHAIVMGDFNCGPDAPEMQFLVREAGLKAPGKVIPSWPSWKPQRMIDHVLVSPSLRIVHQETLPLRISDHLAMAVEVELPVGLEIE